MRGQAEVIGAILLLVIAVALWAVAWNLFYPTYQQASQRLERERLLAEKGLKEYLLVERIYLNNGHVCAWVTNTGDVQTELASLYLNNTLAWSGYIDMKAGASTEVCTNFTQRATYRVKVCSYTNCFEVTDYVP